MAKIRPATDLVAMWADVYRADDVDLLPDGVALPFEPRGAAYVADVLQANLRAIAFYRRLGWTESGAFEDRRSRPWNFEMTMRR